MDLYVIPLKLKYRVRTPLGWGKTTARTNHGTKGSMGEGLHAQWIATRLGKDEHKALVEAQLVLRRERWPSWRH